MNHLRSFLAVRSGVVAATAGVAFLAQLMLAPRPAHAQDTSVHGRVLGQTEDGEHLGPVAGAKVEFRSKAGGSTTATTDANGYYRILDMKTGSYQYHLVAKGFREEKEGRGFDLKADGASVLDFVVTKESPKSPENKKPGEKKPDPKKPDEKKPDPANPPDSPSPNTPAPKAAIPPPPARVKPAPSGDDDASEENARLLVRVVADGGDEKKPIPNATVSIRGGGGVLQSTTGRLGGTRFDVTQGEYRVTASAAGFNPPARTRVVKVDASGRAQALIVLTKDEPRKGESGAAGGTPAKTKPADAPADSDTDARFFGAKGDGTRIVYLVDSSNSMRGAKFEAAAAELKKSVRALSERQKFYVLFFSDAMHPMFEPDAPADMVRATWLNVSRLEKYTSDMKTQQGTRAHEAVDRAFELKPDVIFILSDGAFTDNTRPYLLRMKDNKVPIHTIGFKSTDRGADTLEAISEKHKGTYTAIP